MCNCFSWWTSGTLILYRQGSMMISIYHSNLSPFGLFLLDPINQNHQFMVLILTSATAWLCLLSVLSEGKGRESVAVPIDSKCGLAAGKQLGYSLSLSRHHALSGMLSSECQTGKRPGDLWVTTAAPCRAVHERQRNQMQWTVRDSTHQDVELVWAIFTWICHWAQEAGVTNASKSRR